MQRMLYIALLVAFLGLTVTGLALKYSNQSWGKWLASGLGGFRSAGILHQSFAMFAIVVFAYYLGRVIPGMLRVRRSAAGEPLFWGQTRSFRMVEISVIFGGCSYGFSASVANQAWGRGPTGKSSIIALFLGVGADWI